MSLPSLLKLAADCLRDAQQYGAGTYTELIVDLEAACNIVPAVQPVMAGTVQQPVAYADPQSFQNFKNDKSTNEWMWAKPDAGLVGVYLAAPVAPAVTAGTDFAALNTALVLETERAIRQRDEFLKTGTSTASHGGSHDTCFPAILRQYLGKDAPVAPVTEQGWISVSDRLPHVLPGDHDSFIVAIKRAHNGKTYIIHADYLNAMELENLDSGDNYVWSGWHKECSKPSYDEFFMPVENDGDVITHWREYPDAPTLPETTKKGGA